MSWKLFKGVKWCSREKINTVAEKRNVKFQPQKDSTNEIFMSVQRGGGGGLEHL